MKAWIPSQTHDRFNLQTSFCQIWRWNRYEISSSFPLTKMTVSSLNAIKALKQMECGLSQCHSIVDCMIWDVVIIIWCWTVWMSVMHELSIIRIDRHDFSALRWSSFRYSAWNNCASGQIKSAAWKAWNPGKFCRDDSDPNHTSRFPHPHEMTPCIQRFRLIQMMLSFG
jgi:hypothetical protein